MASNGAPLGDADTKTSLEKIKRQLASGSGRNLLQGPLLKRSETYILALKLKALKTKLKEWSKTAQGNLGIQKQNVLSQLVELDRLQEQRELNEDEIASRLVLDMELKI